MSDMADFFALEADRTRARAAVEAAVAGDDSAWSELFLAHYPQLSRFFRSRLPSADEAEDLAAEVFAEAWRSRDRLRWRNRPFSAWLFGIARRRLASYYRHRPPQEPLDLTGVPDGLSAPADDEQLALEIRDILERLPPEHRTALKLRYVVGLSGLEAAAAMGRSHGAYRAILHRALRAFLKEFQEQE
ncbi:MAG: RNA polymerase sigma factor [Dehalococcoidia bacterium]